VSGVLCRAVVVVFATAVFCTLRAASVPRLYGVAARLEQTQNAALSVSLTDTFSSASTGLRNVSIDRFGFSASGGVFRDTVSQPVPFVDRLALSFAAFGTITEIVGGAMQRKVRRNTLERSSQYDGERLRTVDSYVMDSYDRTRFNLGANGIVMFDETRSFVYGANLAIERIDGVSISRYTDYSRRYDRIDLADMGGDDGGHLFDLGAGYIRTFHVGNRRFKRMASLEGYEEVSRRALRYDESLVSWLKAGTTWKPLGGYHAGFEGWLRRDMGARLRFVLSDEHSEALPCVFREDGTSFWPFVFAALERLDFSIAMTRGSGEFASYHVSNVYGDGVDEVTAKSSSSGVGCSADHLVRIYLLDPLSISAMRHHLFCAVSWESRGRMSTVGEQRGATWAAHGLLWFGTGFFLHERLWIEASCSAASILCSVSRNQSAGGDRISMSGRLNSRSDMEWRIGMRL